MTQRGANYERRPNDLYETPTEAGAVILDEVEFEATICDPCCGGGNLLRLFRSRGHKAVGSDVVKGYDFLSAKFRWPGADVVTNPPYGGRRGELAVKFVERALEVTCRKVAMLLPADFDSAGTRARIFSGSPYFDQKVVLLNRIMWFGGQTGSTNHAWYVWDLARDPADAARITYAIQKREG